MTWKYNKAKDAGRSDSALSFFEGLSRLRDDPVLQDVLSAARGRAIFLVGGALRNIALNASLAPDYDFAFDGDTAVCAREVASIAGGSAFALDEEAGAYRVVAGEKGEVTIDFTPLKAGDIFSDLKGRDFTINAMAVPLSGLLDGTVKLIDPFNGLDDAMARIIRKVSDSIVDDDPLRSMRAVRLSVQYGLSIHKETFELIRTKAGLISRTSVERVRDELMAVFASNDARVGMGLLFETGLIDSIIPEIKNWADVDGYDLLAHSLSVLREAEALIIGTSENTSFPGVSERLKAYFTASAGQFDNSALFRLAAFFHDFGKPFTMTREPGKLRFIGHDSVGAERAREVFERLKLSRKTSGEVCNLIKNHHRTFMLASLKERTNRSKGHFFRAVGGEPGLMLLCLALADARATRGGEDTELYSVVMEMFRFYYDVYIIEKPEPVLKGREIMEIFKVGEGPAVGEIIAILNEGVEKGEINSTQDAIDYVRKRLVKRNKRPVDH